MWPKGPKSEVPALRDFCATSKSAPGRFYANERCVGAAKSLISKAFPAFGSGYEPRGRGFESCQPRQICQSNQWVRCFVSNPFVLPARLCASRTKYS